MRIAARRMRPLPVGALRVRVSPVGLARGSVRTVPPSGRSAASSVIPPSAAGGSSSPARAEAMKSICFDESLRKDLVEKGRARKKNFNWDKTAELLWEAVERSLP